MVWLSVEDGLDCTTQAKVVLKYKLGQNSLQVYIKLRAFSVRNIAG